jgi:acyl-CoA dehydrogenase-like protein
MADMVNSSRLSNAVRAAALMRRAVTEAFFIARRRHAFGRRLVEFPLMRRQLAKMLVWSEQARTMVFQTAEALELADRGDRQQGKLLRILTPLIKFRACRDARKVAGDAMEVRGGCGYIEEWSDARILRDAHLGSIWEGTSNIVALDVRRAITRENSLPELREVNFRRLHEASLDPELQRVFSQAIDRACAFAESITSAQNEHLVRQAASCLYHITSAVGLAQEAEKIGAPHRLAMAQMVLKHRLLPSDPLQQDGDDEALLGTMLEA